MKKLVMLIGFMTFASQAQAAISVDCSTSNFKATGVISATATVVNSGAMCYVCFGVEGTITPTSVKFGGSAMTLVSSSTVYDYTYLYKLASPGTGSQGAVVAWTNTNPTSIGVICLDGVNTGADRDALGHATGTTSPTSDSVVVNTATDATVDCLYMDPETTGNPVPTGGQKIQLSVNDAVDGQGIVMSTQSYTSTGTKTLTYTYTGTVQWTALSQSIAAAAGGTTGVSLNRGLAITGGKTIISGGETRIK